MVAGRLSIKSQICQFSGESSLNVLFAATEKDNDEIGNTYIDLNTTLGNNRKYQVRGTIALFEGFGSSVFSIRCISISNNVNINRSPEINIFDQDGPYDCITGKSHVLGGVAIFFSVVTDVSEPG